jgi:hypothetical protein
MTNTPIDKQARAAALQPRISPAFLLLLLLPPAMLLGSSTQRLARPLSARSSAKICLMSYK